jgi:hypothetical protein
MGKLVNYLKITFHISKLELTMLLAYATLKWKVRRATGSFKTALINEGVPEEVASTLAQSYNQANKKILRFVDTGRMLASEGHQSKDVEA